MIDRLHERLAERYSSYEIVRQLHDVPPHEVYEVRIDGRPAVYKGDVGSTGNAGVEGRVLAFVEETTPIPVPEPLHVGSDWFLAAWHPDAPEAEGSHEEDEAWARAAGRVLARLHEETAPFVDSYGLFQVEGEVRRLADGVSSGGADPIEDAGLSIDGGDEYHDAALGDLHDRRPVLDRFGHADIADRAIECLESVPEIADGVGEPVCCHGWATPEHVAVRDGCGACMLDFEHAIAAPAEFDYWRTVGPAFGDDESLRRAFREGYESVHPLADGFEARRSLFALLNGVYYFESLYVQDQHDEEATERKANRLREQVLETIERLEGQAGR